MMKPLDLDFVRNKIIFDDSSSLKDVDAGDSDVVVVGMGDGAAADQYSRGADLPNSSTGNPKKRVRKINDDVHFW